MERIIPSLADTDLYKITMHRMVSQLYPEVQVRYRFFDRSKTVYPQDFHKVLREQVDMMADVSFDTQSLEYLRKVCGHFLSDAHLTNLSGFKFNPSEIYIDQQDGELEIKSQGYWQHRIFDEIIVMALVNEIYNDMMDIQPDSSWYTKTMNDRDFIKSRGLQVAEFGTRRRHSHKFQAEEIKILAPTIVGTSNVYLGARSDIKLMGTMAHEVFQTLGALYGVQSANRRVMEDWSSVYNGSLGIALPDTFTTEVFLRDFDLHFAKAFSGVRQDSGDPFEFLEKMYQHYLTVGLTPEEIKNRSIIFSDGLTPYKALKIAQTCAGRIRCSFGIGTYFSNPGQPRNVVMKIVAATRPGHPWYKSIKLSDTPGKVTGDPETKELTEIAVRHLLGIA